MLSCLCCFLLPRPLWHPTEQLVLTTIRQEASELQDPGPGTVTTMRACLADRFDKSEFARFRLDDALLSLPPLLRPNCVFEPEGAWEQQLQSRCLPHLKHPALKSYNFEWLTQVSLVLVLPRFVIWHHRSGRRITCSSLGPGEMDAGAELTPTCTPLHELVDGAANADGDRLTLNGIRGHPIWRCPTHSCMLTNTPIMHVRTWHAWWEHAHVHWSMHVCHTARRLWVGLSEVDRPHVDDCTFFFWH